VPFLLPQTFREACELLAEDPERVPIAGGTDLLVDWPQRFDRQAKTYIDLWKLAELKSIDWSDDALTLGATATFWNAICDPRVREELPLLAYAARRVGALQIQTRGTWAGNIINASPAADGAAVLMAHDAVVELASAGGAEEVPLADLYLGHGRLRRRPDQLVRAIRIPRRAYSVRIFEKVGARAAQAIAKLSVTVTRSDVGWRVVAGGMAPRVCRCTSLERLLESETPIASPEDLLPGIRTDLAPADDIRSSAAYRERVMARVAYSALGEVCPWFEGRL
jgi:CO/xanthine dehydrogenase FAD-binding subunit